MEHNVNCIYVFNLYIPLWNKHERHTGTAFFNQLTTEHSSVLDCLLMVWWLVTLGGSIQPFLFPTSSPQLVKKAKVYKGALKFPC